MILEFSVRNKSSVGELLALTIQSSPATIISACPVMIFSAPEERKKMKKTKERKEKREDNR